ncbi:MAG: DUF975 family protein [Sarcina sp.]
MENNDYGYIKEHPRSADFRREGLRRLKGNWPIALLISLVWIVVSMALVTTLKLIGGNIIEQLSFIIIWPLSAGMLTIFLGISRGRKEKFGTLFCMFTSPSRFFKSIAITFLVALGTVIGMILLILPGLWFSYTFSQSLVVFLDNNEIGIIEAMKESMRIMKNEKWNLFKLQITFIGWWILVCVGVSILTTVIVVSGGPLLMASFGASIGMIIGITWLAPYFFMSIISFYNFIKKQAEEKK